jgi:tRNA-binding protein
VLPVRSLQSLEGSRLAHYPADIGFHTPVTQMPHLRGGGGRGWATGYGLAMDDTITWDDFAKVDIRVGRVVEVNEFPEARRPAWKLRIDFGPDVGIKSSSAQITSYGKEELLDRLVLAVVNFPPRQIGPFWSEVLTLGTYRGKRVLLVTPEPDAEPGDRLG